MKRLAAFGILALAGIAGGCTTTGRQGPVDVTRYHFGAPLARGSFIVEASSGAMTVSPEYQSYADAVGRAMVPLGFTPAAPNTTSEYIAAVSFTRAGVGEVQRRSPVSIGIGGGTGGGGFRGGGLGIGGGVGFGLGGGGRQEVIVSELAVQIRRRSDATTIWEGRAQTQGVGIDANQPGPTADRLANALFQGFPGESGITTTVK